MSLKFLRTAIVLFLVGSTGGLAEEDAPVAFKSTRSVPTPSPSGIFGATDQRVPVPSDEWPWTSIGRFNIDIRASGSVTCSGVLIGPRHVLTAAHCLFDPRQNRFVAPEQVTFFAGLTVGNKFKGRSVAADIIKDPKVDFRLGYRPRHDMVRPDMLGRDWAIVILKDALDLKPIPLGFVHNADFSNTKSRPEIARAGYSGDRRFMLSMHRGCALKTDIPSPGELIHECDLMPGDSGSPILVLDGDATKVIGIANGIVEDFKTGVGYRAIIGVGVSAHALEKKEFWLDPKLAEIKRVEDGGVAVQRDDGVTPEAARAAYARLLSDKGLPLAQTALGWLYASGQGVARDDAEAVKLYRRAADQGVARAQYGLALMYAYGRGVPQNAEEAVKLYRLAADQGDVRAQYKLGMSHTFGVGAAKDIVNAYVWVSLAAALGFQDAIKQRDVLAQEMTPQQKADAEMRVLAWRPKFSSSNFELPIPLDTLSEAYASFVKGDDKTALRLLPQLAEDGSAEAEYLLGTMLNDGRGVQRDYQKAVDWYYKAAIRGEPEAIFKIAAMYDGRASPADLTEAVRVYRVAADGGLDLAQYRLGFMYLQGRGVSPDLKAALASFEKAANQGYGPAQHIMGELFATGRGVEKDDSEASKWFKLAAEHGVANAQEYMGYMYDVGRGVPTNPQEAIRWYTYAAAQGNRIAQRNLGAMHAFARGIPKDNAQALSWYLKAAKQGEPDAQFNAGLLYANGDGVAKDNAEAAKWYRLAADQSHPAAQFYLGFMYQYGQGVPRDLTAALMWFSLSAAQGNQNAKKTQDLLLQSVDPSQVAEAKKLAAEWRPAK